MKKTDQATAPPKSPMTLDDMTCELAACLRDAIEETDLAYLKKDPEDAFTDLACRLIFRLRSKLTVVPTHYVAERAAAGRILDIFTRWLREHPGCSYTTRISASGKFQVVVKTPIETTLHFGESVQDAYAQAAQTISFNGETL